MAELSRKKRFQELRDQLDQEVSQLQEKPSAPVPLSRSQKPASAVQTEDANAAKPVQQTVAVMDELLGEVKQYNISKGDRVAEDTQINILRTLDEASDIEMKRKAHLETMEPNLEAGGTTMNINSKDIAQVSRAAAGSSSILNLKPKQPQPVFEEEEDVIIALPSQSGLSGYDTKPADQQKIADKLDLFDLSADDFHQSEAPKPAKEPEEPVSRKEAKKAEKARRKAEKARRSSYEEEEADYEEPVRHARDYQEEEESSKSGIIGNIILIVLILALICLIGYTIYLISRANLL